MKIKIRTNAVDLYIQENTDFDGFYFGKDKWERAMEKIAGKILEVDTKNLFKYEYNTLPIEGVTKKGIRIMDTYVEEVIDDIRPGKARCELCNEVSDSTESCTNCGRSEYLEPFVDE